MLPIPLIATSLGSADNRIYLATRGDQQGAYVYNSLGEVIPQSTLLPDLNRTLWDATLDSTGAYYTAGNFDPNTFTYTISKYDSNLNLQWTKNTGSQTYAIHAVYNTFFLIDEIYVGTAVNGIKKYSSGGLLLWTVDEYLGEPITDVDSIFNITSNIYFTGAQSSQKYLFIIDEYGNVFDRYLIGLNEYAYGDIFGFYTYGQNLLRKWTDSFDLIWTYDNGGLINDLITDQFGNIYIACVPPSASDIFARKLNLNGVIQWSVNGFDAQSGYSIVLDSFNSVYVGASKQGQTDPNPLSTNLYKFTNAGDLQWFSNATGGLVSDIKVNF